MNADDRPPTTSDDDGADDLGHAALAGGLRVLLAAHVDDTIATDEAWAEIVRSARDHRTARTRRRTAAIAVLSAAALIVAFVVVRLEASREDPQQLLLVTPSPEPDPTEGAAPDSWVRLLAHGPATAVDEGPFWLVDLRRARDQSGVEALADGASADAWRAHSQATFGFDNVLASPLGSATPEQVRAELGFGPEQFDQVLVMYGVGVGRYVATGRFDRSAIAAAVAADPLWGPDLRVREEGGLTVYAWGEDGMRLTRKRSPMRDLGAGGRLVVGDGWLAWCNSDDEVAALLAATADARTSAAAEDPIRASVEDGDDGRLTDLIVTPADLPERSTTSPRPPPLPELDPIDRPLVWSGGSSRTASGPVEQFRFGYASEAQAADNLAAYRQNWARFAGDSDLRVEQRGSGLVATVRLSPATAGVGVIGELSDGSTQRLNAGSFQLYLNLTG